jgi:hypothetical protein
MMRLEAGEAAMPDMGARQNLGWRGGGGGEEVKTLGRFRERGLTYARHMRAAVPALIAMTNPLLNPIMRSPLADSTGCVTIVAPRAEPCSNTCSAAA